MGSFNTSCFVSRQTIAPGDACMVIPIQQQSTYEQVALTYNGEESAQYGVCSSTCYPTRFWRPVGAFIEAEYDDYGRFTLKDSPLNRFKLKDFINEALKMAPVVAQGDNKYHDLAYDLTQFMQQSAADLLAVLTAKGEDKPASTDGDLLWSQSVACWDYIYEVSQEQRMFWRNYKGALRPMNFAAMHRLAFDELVAMTNAYVGWDNESYEMRAFFDRAMAETKERLAELDASIQGETEDAAARKHLRKFFAFDRLRDSLRRVGGSEGSHYPCEGTVFHGAADAYLEGKLDDERLYAVLKPWLEVRYAYSGLEALNLHFEPIVYASQDYQNDVGASYARFVGKVSKAVSKGRILHYCGPLQDYQVTVEDPGVFDVLAKKVREWDGYLEVEASIPDQVRPGCTQVSFQCSLELSDLREFLAEPLEEVAAGCVHLDSLASRTAG